ncbi:hypothetical protein GIB67_041588 [Kingdonia uniflora]|uniref:Uncharacterized protein n=1 Tax=Kingdonia uniflora TaxID=39325 RepID=A0A7J7MQM7_9MAGN|nr:hypothetical protein GIB67_041588 [Kingdonia uniflora]
MIFKLEKLETLSNIFAIIISKPTMSSSVMCRCTLVSFIYVRKEGLLMNHFIIFPTLNTIHTGLVKSSCETFSYPESLKPKATITPTDSIHKQKA